MNHQAPSFTVRRLLLSLLCVCFFTGLAAFGADVKKTYNVPAGPAEQSLKTFSAQSGLEVLFATKSTGKIATKAVKGDYTAREAIDQMLAGTDLSVAQDTKTGAFTITSVPNGSRVAQKDSDRPDQSKVEDGKLVLDKVEVTGRVDGLNNKGLLPTGEKQPIYHETITRAEIERLGVTSFEELFRYIPQTTSGENGFQAAPNNANTSGGTVANISRVGLRGFSQTQTLILINGRIQPRSGTSSSAGTDLSRIPIAAIERIEILPLSGSAIYGGGAVGGAINIILRKDFAAKELTTYFGTSWDGGATEYRVSYFDGRAFELFGRKTNLTILLDFRHRDPLYQGDRNYLQRVLAKYGPNTTVRNAAGVSAFELFTLNALAGSPATILVGNAPTAAVNDLGIPGSPGVRFATVPSGTTVSQSVALTPDSFTATAGKFTPGERFARQTIYNPEDNYSVNLNLEHVLSPSLTLYAEAGYIFLRSANSFPQSMALSLTATDPLNPFRTNVTPGFVGRPIRVFFDAFDIADPSALEERETIRGLLGVKGKLFEKWEWSLDGNYDYNHTYTSSNNRTNYLPTLLGATGLTGTDSVTGQPQVPAPLATRRAIYPVLADHSLFPVPVSDTDKYWFSFRNSGTITHNFIGLGRVTGPIHEFATGPVNVEALGTYTYFDLANGQHLIASDDTFLQLSGFPFRDTPSGNFAKRTTISGALEAVVPVFNDKWRPQFIPFTSLELNFGARGEKVDSGSGAVRAGPLVSDSKQGKSYVVAAKLQLSRDIAFRYSLSSGLFVPDWGSSGSSIEFPNFQVTPDPKRGNTSQPSGTYTVRNGGNPAVKSETSTSENYGLIFTPRFAKGLSITVDYWKITKKDGIAQILAPQLILLEDQFPDRFTRAPLTPADQALGYTAGLITYLNQTALNVSRIWTDGFDVQLNYEFDAGAAGRFTASANSTFTNQFTTLNTPGSVPIDTAGVSGPRHWRGRAALTWSKNRWEATVSSRYSGHYSTLTTAPTAATPTAFPFDGGRIPAFIRYDMQISYAMPAASTKGWRGWFSGTKWTVGCQNILNDAPAMVSDGTGFYDRQDDPRQRFVYVSIKKSL